MSILFVYSHPSPHLNAHSHINFNVEETIANGKRTRRRIVKCCNIIINEWHRIKFIVKSFTLVRSYFTLPLLQLLFSPLARRKNGKSNELVYTTQKFPALKNGFYASNKASANKTEEKF